MDERKLHPRRMFTDPILSPFANVLMQGTLITFISIEISIDSSNTRPNQSAILSNRAFSSAFFDTATFP